MVDKKKPPQSSGNTKPGQPGKPPNVNKGGVRGDESQYDGFQVSPTRPAPRKPGTAPRKPDTGEDSSE